MDYAGVLLSSLGLAGLTYGIIRAGQDGWSNATALATIAAGVVLLVAFAGWERTVGRVFKAQPLIELSLFRSAGFTWGTILATLVSFAMFGIMFAMPQYFQEVRGVDALGSGLRMLPMIGGMLVGMIGGTRLQSPRRNSAGLPGDPVAGAKTMVTVGFAVMAAALAVGALTSITSGTGFAAAWFAVAGLGLGLSMPSAMNAALGALSAERSGAGSALITAMRQVGATIGVAVLGTILGSAYRSHLIVTGLPAAIAGAAKSSVAAGVAVSHELRSASLLDSVRTAFVHGMDIMLWTCAGIAIVSAALALAFLPRRPGPVREGEAGSIPAGAGENGSQRAGLGL
jgi:hypothetical protein